MGERVRAVDQCLKDSTSWYQNLLRVSRQPKFMQRYFTDIITHNYPEAGDDLSLVSFVVNLSRVLTSCLVQCSLYCVYCGRCYMYCGVAACMKMHCNIRAALQHCNMRAGALQHKRYVAVDCTTC